MGWLGRLLADKSCGLEWDDLARCEILGGLKVLVLLVRFGPWVPLKYAITITCDVSILADSALGMVRLSLG